MDTLNVLKNKPVYFLVFGIILLTIACICAYVELHKTGKPADVTLRAISIISFVLGIVLALSMVLFSGYKKYCYRSVAEDAKYSASPGIELVQ